METLISVRNLSFKNTIVYPNLDIPRNTVTFVSGESGCGKSTLFKILNASISPDSGCVLYKGNDITTIDAIKIRREMLLVNQSPFLFRGSIVDNFKSFHEFRQSESPDYSDICTFLELCCIKDAPGMLCQNMSGGERQRVFLSIALSMNFEVLLLDEPTSALNSELSEEVIDNIASYVKSMDKTLLIISHDSALQNSFAQNVITLGRKNG